MYAGPLGPVLTSTAPFARLAPYGGAVSAALLSSLGSRWGSLLVAAASAATRLVTQPAYPAVHSGDISSAGTDTLRVLAHNVLTTNPTAARGFARYAYSCAADVVVVVEGTAPMFAAESAALEQEYEHTYLHNPSSPEAVAVYSRFPIVDVEEISADNPRLGFGVELDVRGRGLLLLAVHPKAPVKPSWVQQWLTDLRQIRDCVNERLVPAVAVAGDFNADQAHEPFRRLLRDACLQETHNAGNTWPAGAVVPPFYGIDHILTGGPIEVVSASTTPAHGSDHFGVLSVLRLH